MLKQLFLVLATPDFVSGYTFHGDAELVFREFFGESNPFAGETVNMVMRDRHAYLSLLQHQIQWVGRWMNGLMGGWMDRRAEK